MKKTSSASRLYFVLFGTIVLGELLVVWLLRALPPMPPLASALVAALVLLVALVPVIVRLGTHSADVERAHVLLQTREAQLRATLESTVDGILAVDNAGKVMHVSRRFAELWRVPAELLARGDDHELLAFVLSQLKDPTAFLAKVQALYEGDAAGSDVLQFKDGRVFERDSRPMMAEGVRIGRVWSFRDVTERNRANLERDVLREIAHGVATSTDFQSSLRSMHRSLQRVFDAQNCFVALHDARTGDFSFPYFADERDAAPTQPVAIPRSCTAYVLRTGTPTRLTPAVFDGLVAAGEIDLVGSPSPAWMGVPLRTPTGVIGVLVLQHYTREDAYAERDLAFLASVGDQTAMMIERRVTEEALRESERRLREAQDLAELGSWDLDFDSGVMIASESLCRMVGRDPALTSAPWAELPRYFTPESWNRLERVAQAAADGTPREVVLEVIREDGRHRIHQGTVVAVRVASGGVGRLRGAVFDVTDRRQAEEAAAALEAQLQQAHRVASVGRLAGGIAHEFNNKLTVILGNVELALMEQETSQRWRVSLLEVKEAARRSAELTRQLLAYAQRQSVARRVLDLSQAVVSQLASLRRVGGEGIRVEWHAATDLWPVAMDPSQFSIILSNLCVNAREAGADVVELLLQNVAVDAATAAASPKAAPGDYVRLRVRDNGCGMDAEALTHAFEPFFTTKGVGEGPGLGLAEVFGAMQQNSGFVRATSTPGQGTAVDLYLPRHTSV